MSIPLPPKSLYLKEMAYFLNYGEREGGGAWTVDSPDSLTPANNDS